MALFLNSTITPCDKDKYAFNLFSNLLQDIMHEENDQEIIVEAKSESDHLKPPNSPDAFFTPPATPSLTSENGIMTLSYKPHEDADMYYHNQAFNADMEKPPIDNVDAANGFEKPPPPY